MKNNEFLAAISNSFNLFLECGTSRSTLKLEPLHGFIAHDLAQRLGSAYHIYAIGYSEKEDEKGKEQLIAGRYFDKRVDITVVQNEKPVCGIAVKFVMQNYSQNANNYFENMLGETANIRCTHCPYFQIFIVFDKLPHYNRNGNIVSWETFTEHHIQKYLNLSNDDVECFFHTPNKTLVYVLHIPDNDELKNKTTYLSYHRQRHTKAEVSPLSCNNLGCAVILNNYDAFMEKVYHTILSR